MSAISVITFIVFTALVALVSWYVTRREKLSTTDGYFLGGRHLGWFLVGGSLFLSNISAGSMVGESEAVYLFNMSVMMWGFSSIVAMVLVSEFILPIYLRFGVATTPQFLGIRFGPSLKRWIGTLLVISYTVNLMPAVLYSGAVVFDGMFDISGLLGISEWAAIWVLVWSIGIVGSIYAIFGGLKAIATSDAINGVGLVIGGLLVTYLGFVYLGDGDFGDGLHKVVSENTEHLNVIGGPKDPAPWPTLFTGMLLVNLNYWGMEQYIIQRSLGSRDLASGQKGMVFGMLLKFIAPLITAVPGLIAVAIFMDVDVSAKIYPMLVAEVVPPYLIGFIAAIIFGAALTTYNSGLNSTSTIAMLDLYKPYKEKHNRPVSDKEIIKISKRFQYGLAIAAMTVAPFIALGGERGFYEYFQKVAGFFSVPIFTIVLVGFITKKVPAVAAKFGLLFYLLCYGYTQLINNFGLHFLHIMAILFVVTSIIMFTIGALFPQENEVSIPKGNFVNMEPWRPRFIFYAIMLSGMICVIYLLSPLGLASA